MKEHMIGWKIFFIVMGVLAMVGAAVSLLMMQFADAAGLLAAGLGMFMTASVCAWMDDMLAAICNLRGRNANSRRRAAQTEEPQQDWKEEPIPSTIEDAYRMAQRIKK